MTNTYNDILNRMKKTFYNESGENPDESGEILARLKAAATEIFSLYTFGDFITKQAYLKTASGEYLDRIGETFCLKRKSKCYAFGEATFCCAENEETVVTIPKGLIVCSSAEPYIQYTTLESATVSSENTEATVKIRSVEAGSKYNRTEGFIDTMVNPPAKIISVTNKKKITGAFDDETDDKFRKRISVFFNRYLNGYNKASIEKTILDYDEVQDCYVANPNISNNIYVYIRPRENDLTKEFVDKVEKSFEYFKMLNSALIVEQALPDYAYSHVTVGKDAYKKRDEKELTKEIKETLLQINSQTKMGEYIRISDVENKINEINGVRECSVACSNANGDIVPCEPKYFIEFVLYTEVGFYDV